MKKKILSVLLVIVMLFAMIPTSLAAESEHSQVWRDLSSMEFDGESWDNRDFPADAGDKGVYVVAVDEVGFRKNGELSGYAFFLYLYNPSGATFNFKNGSNTVQMAVAWNDDGTPKEYEKFKIELVNISNETGYNNVFLKVRVVDRLSNYDGTTMKTRLLATKSRRVYDISSVELSLPDGTIKDHAYGCSVIVRGYDAGHGEGNEASTKEITYTPATTLTLDVQHAYWRTQSSSKGVNHKHQINSAYFTIPGDVWSKYKELYSIKCTWEEHKTTPMIVTDDQALYDDLKRYLFVGYQNMTPEPQYHLYSDLNLLPDGTLYGKFTANYAYNPYIKFGGMFDPNNQFRYGTINQKITRLAWLFKAKNEIQLNEESISAAEVLAYYEKNKSMGEPLFLEDAVDEGREQWRNGMTVYFGDNDNPAFDLSNYDSANPSWLQKLLDYNWFNGGAVLGKGLVVDTDEVYPHFTPITVFEYDNENGQYLRSAEASAYDMTEKYFFNDTTQAQSFMTYTEKALASGDVVVLFRYASTDYFSESFSVFPSIDGHAYVATQTFFKDFDVIQLQFKDEDMSISTVAVVNDPENSTGGVQGPTTSPDADLVIDQLRKEWSIMLQDMGAVFKWIFAGILLCALIPLLIKGVELLADILTEGGKNTTHTRPKGRRRGSTRRKNK